MSLVLRHPAVVHRSWSRPRTASGDRDPVPDRGAIPYRRAVPTEGPFPTGEPNVFGQLGEPFAQFLAGLAIAMIVLPPVIAVLWVVWTRLILEALVVHFKVEDNTRRTPLVDQTQLTS